jgi:hypothetical protein
MEKISSLLKVPRNKSTAGPNSERAQLIGYFTDQVNKERDGKKLKKVTPRYIAVKLAHLSVSDLYYMKSTLSDYQARGNSFSKGFFGQLKVRPQ